MKVLLLPINIASMPAVTADALNRIKGIEAKCLTQSLSKYNSSSSTTIYLPTNVSKRKIFQWLKFKLRHKAILRHWIRWADVLHYVWSPALSDGQDLQWAVQWGKPVFVEWLGSDIRKPGLLNNCNPHFQKAYQNGYEYRDVESDENPERVQQLFADVKAVPLLCPEMSLFLNRALFPTLKLLFQRINCSDFEPVYPRADTAIPLIIHSPSAMVTKGTSIILPLIEELKKEYRFEFLLLHDLPRSEVLTLLKKADILLDQLIIGGYGMAALEAMSHGKPVLCHVMPEVFGAGLPAECPVVCTHPGNLREQLVRLIGDGALRNELGKKSRAYVEQYHDADKLATELAHTYQQSMTKNEG